MKVSEKIKRITDILKVNGCFSIGELEGENSILVGTLGNYVGLAEYFTEDYAEVNVYEPRSTSSDPVDTYEESYWDLNENATFSPISFKKIYIVLIRISNICFV
jgi:hypothetical protein